MLCITLLLCTTKNFGQKFDVTLDYTVTYLLPETNDTIKVSVANQGKYLYTDSELVANTFGSEFAKSFGNIDNDKIEVKLLMKLADLQMLFNVKSGKTSILMDLNLISFLPKKDSVSDEITQLIANKKDEHINLMNKEYSLFDMYPKKDTGDRLVFAFDSDFPINYELNFTEFFKHILGNSIKFSMPNGLIVYLKNKKNQEIIRAIKIERESRKLSADLNFYIK